MKTLENKLLEIKRKSQRGLLKKVNDYMRRKIAPAVLYASAGLSAIVGSYGCGKSGGGGGVITEIPKTTKVLDDPSGQQLLDYSEIDGKLTFSGTTGQLDSLVVDDIYISSVNPITPNGFIRRVTNIYPSSGDMIVETMPATLEDAITTGSVSISKDLTFTDVKAKLLREGVESIKGGSFNVGINNVVLYDADGNLTTTTDQVVANGSIVINPSFDFNLNIENFKIKQFTFVNKTTEEAQLQLSTSVSGLGISNKVEIARYNITPVTVWIGYVPIVLTPTLTINVGLDGNVSSNITTSVTQQATVNAGLSYNGNWSHINNFTNSFQFNEPSISADALLKAYAGPNLNLSLYGIAGAYGEINGYLTLDADTIRNPWWLLYGGLEAKVGVKFDVLGYSIADYDATVLDYNKVLAQATGSFLKGNIAFESERDGNDEIYIMNADGTSQTNLTNNTAIDNIPAWSPDGSKIAFTSSRDGNYEIYVMNANGSGQTNLTNNPSGDGGPAWSPDGTKIAFHSYRNGNGEIYVMNADGTSQTNLTNNSAWDEYPAWSPDGSKIAFESTRDGNGEIYVMNADGTSPVNLTNNPAEDNYPSWSPDGSKIAFESIRDGGYEIYVMNTDGTNQTRLTNNSTWDGGPAWSPDGTKIAFHSTRDGNREIYVMNADGTNQTNLTNNPAADIYPSWSPNKQ